MTVIVYETVVTAIIVALIYLMAAKMPRFRDDITEADRRRARRIIVSTIVSIHVAIVIGSLFTK